MFRYTHVATDSTRACSWISVQCASLSHRLVRNRRPLHRITSNGHDGHRAKDVSCLKQHATFSTAFWSRGTTQPGPYNAQLLDSTIKPFGDVLTEGLGSDGKPFSTSPDGATVPTAGGRRHGPSPVLRSSGRTGSKLWRVLTATCPLAYNSRTERRKVDLSYVDARAYEALGRKALELPRTQQRSSSRNAISKITAEYVKQLHVGPEDGGVKYQPDPNRALLSVFSDNNMSFLQQRGYDVEDIVTWAWVLTSRTADQAAMKMRLVASGVARSARGVVPIFVILHVLRARSIGPAALRDLLRIVQRECHRSGTHEPQDFRSSTLANQTIVILIVRLLRHARIVAPALLDPIANLTCTLLISRKADQDAAMEPMKAQRLCHIYNRILSLLALPTSSNPYRMVAIQQRAQFRLLRSMMEFRPQLPVTREGYRAMIKLQVAHRKVDRERKWALAKAASWPPWRSVKLGIEEDVDHPGQRSRAGEILMRQNQAGYTHLHYERHAQILAGWDTDKSPTIQKRSIASHGLIHWLQSTFTQSVPAEKQVDHLIWTARIYSTRTVREAWACFCSYDTEVEMEGRAMDPYRAMFDKLFANMHEPGRETPAVPGDGREVYADPISSRDQIFVPSEPPDIRTFYEKMLRDKVQPAGRLLAGLIDHAQSLDEGLKYIEECRFSEVRKDLLLNAHKYSENTVRDVLNNLPDYFLGAFVRLLGRFSDESERRWLLPQWTPMARTGNAESDLAVVSARTYAFHLLDISGTRYTPAWNALLQANKANRPKSGIGHRSRVDMGLDFQNIQDRMRAHHVHPDHSTFVISFSHFEDSILGKDMTENAWRHHFQEQFRAAKLALARAKWLFAVAVGAEDRARQQWLSWSENTVVLSTPPSIALQLLVNLLGCGRDVKGIVELVRWMDRFSTELSDARDEGNDTKYLRRSLILMRLFLEPGWFADAYKASDLVEAEGESHLHEVRDIVGRHTDWGGWPDKEEVREYLHGREKWVRRIERAARAAQASTPARKEQSHMAGVCSVSTATT